MLPKTRLLPRQLLLGRLGSRLPWWTCGPVEESLLAPEEFESKLQSVAHVFEEYAKARGDPERLKVAVYGLTPVVVTLPPSSRKLKARLERCIETLEKVLVLPGPLLGRKECEAAKQYLEFLLHSRPDQDAYYRYWGPHEEPEDQRDRILTIGRPPAIRTGRSGRKRGSTIGMLLAVLAREFTLRFGGPRWNDLSAIVGAVTDRDFIPEIVPQTLMVRTRPYMKKCEALHRYLFE